MAEIATKEIIIKAKKYLSDTFGISSDDISLEEITYQPDKHEWSTTFGYYEIGLPPPENGFLPSILRKYSKRYKIVTTDESGKFKSIKKHEID